MSDVLLRVGGKAGRVTLNRPAALNALTAAMTREIDAALARWATDPSVRLVVMDSAGEKAFCAGGDLTELYERAVAGDHRFGQDFWRDEYRLNARIAEYPKPVVVFMRGFTLGGGVGLACHAAHRIVGDSARVALPECAIGLIPDVGGSWLLARAPGALGAYLALTADRMRAADALYAGFADAYLPEAAWPEAIEALEAEGALAALKGAGAAPEPSALAARQADIDAFFSAGDVQAILTRLADDAGPLAEDARARIARHSPVAMGCALGAISAAQASGGLRDALTREYRYTHRAQAQGDFIEGVRALIIDKDRAPRWRSQAKGAPAGVADPDAVAVMMAPLGDDELSIDQALSLNEDLL